MLLKVQTSRLYKSRAVPGATSDIFPTAIWLSNRGKFKTTTLSPWERKASRVVIGVFTRGRGGAAKPLTDVEYGQKKEQISEHQACAQLLKH